VFESISIGRAALVDVATVGTLAECLLFYGHVHVIVDHPTFTTLARVCGPETLVGLVQDGYLAITFLENRPAIASRETGTGERHGFVFYEAKGYDSQNLIPRVLQELTGKSGKGRRLAGKLLAKISTKRYTTSELAGVIDEVIDPSYTDRVVPELLSAIAPTYTPPANSIFRVHRISDASFANAFVVETNIDLDRANVEYRKAKPAETLSKSLLIDYLYEGSAEIAFAANTTSELALAKTESLIIEAKLSTTLERSTQSNNVRSAFQRVAVPGARSVAEAVNEGRRSLEDVRRLLPKAEKFRKWLASQPCDADLIQNYVQETTSLDWVSELPAKTLRFVLFNAAQIALGAAIAGPPGAVAGLVIGASDTFLLDKIAAGWKPHQFIRGPFAKFLGQAG
jgi:hypothetical protein